jgi:signal transduction protein with GAF and PtsI domain
VKVDHEAYYHALYRVTVLVHASLDLDHTLEVVVKSVAEAMKARACALRLLDPTGRVLDLVASTGLSTGYLSKGRIEVASSPVDQEALSGRVVAIGDVASDSRLQYTADLLREGIQSVLVAPLIRHGTPMGVLRVYANEQHQFEQDEVDFLQALADICALAIENARLFSVLQESTKVGVDAFWGTRSR